MISGSLPRRYARGLLLVALERDQLVAFGEQLNQLAAAFAAAPRSLQALANRWFPLQERHAAVKELAQKFKLEPALAQFLHLLIDKERLEIFAEIVREFGRYRDEREGVVRGRVSGAEAPAEKTIEGLAQLFSQRLKKTVKFAAAARPDLLGGLTIELGSTVYDGSVRQELRRLKQKMLGQMIS